MKYWKFKPTKEEFCSAFKLIKSNSNFTKIKDKLIDYDKKHNNYLDSNIISSSNEELVQQRKQIINKKMVSFFKTKKF